MFIATKGSEVDMNPKGWIEIRWGSVIDAEEYMTIAGHMLGLVTKIEDTGKPPYGLIDFSRLVTITEDAARLATKATRDLGFAKIAGVGIKPEHDIILKTIKENSTRAETIQEFKERAEAEAWLLSK